MDLSQAGLSGLFIEVIQWGHCHKM